MAGIGGIVKTAYEVKNEEQKDFRALNDKLALYVQKMRQLGPGESTTFLSTLQSVEDGMENLKRHYEEELDNLRRQLDAANRDKNKAISEAEKMSRLAGDFEDRYNAEASKNSGLLGEINQLQNRIAQLEQELSNLRSAARMPETQLAGAKEDLRQALAKNRELSAELDMEKANIKHLKDKVADLEQKLDFNRQLHNEQLKDANARMNKSKDVIGQLEAKTKELESQSASVPGMLASMRHKTDQEIQNYKAETEAAHSKNIAALKQQIDNQAAALDQLRATVTRLQTDNDNLLSKIRGLEGQVRELKSQKAGLEDQLRQERGRSIDQIRALERKLKDLQDLIFVKMQEANANRDVQVSLRAELEAYRAILEGEENRIGRLISPGSGTVYYTNTSSSYGMPAGFSGGSRGQEKRYMYTDEEIRSCQTGSQVGDRALSVPPSRQFVRYNDMSEYMDSYCGKDTFRRAQSLNEQNIAFKDMRSHTCADGFPKLRQGDMGSPRIYTPRSPDVRGNGTFANAFGGRMRNSFPRVY